MTEKNDVQIWEPIQHIPKQLYLERIVDDDKGLNVTLNEANSDNVLSFYFQSVISYQNIDETNTLKRLDSFPILSTEWPLFICNESTYIDWLIDQSWEIVKRENLCHYILTHGDGIMDIVAYVPPDVKWL